LLRNFKEWHSCWSKDVFDLLKVLMDASALVVCDLESGNLDRMSFEHLTKKTYEAVSGFNGFSWKLTNQYLFQVSSAKKCNGY
jgi:hypothetical protein